LFLCCFRGLFSFVLSKLDFIIVSYSIYVSQYATSMLTMVRKFKRRHKIVCVSSIYGIDIGNTWNIFDWIKKGMNCFMLLMTILWLCFKLKQRNNAKWHCYSFWTCYFTWQTVLCLDCYLRFKTKEIQLSFKLSIRNNSTNWP
jgi:hypothetical protein